MADDEVALPPLPGDDERVGDAAHGQLVGIVRGVAGALAGGALAYWAFGWIVGQGFYAMVLPGGLIGVGCGLASRRRSVFLGIVCAIATVPFCLFLEWKFCTHFTRDPSFRYLLLHAHRLQSVTLILIGIGAAIAYWFGMGRERR